MRPLLPPLIALCVAGTVVAKEASRIFLLSSFSHDDTDQWPMIPHFMAHYRDYLGLRPERFLLLLHSDSRNHTGLQRMADWLFRRYRVGAMVPVTEPYSSKGHLAWKLLLLNRYVSSNDWVIQVDADEFVFFPGAQHAEQALQQLEISGQNVQFGLMVDRLAADGSVEHAPRRGSIFEQFPLNCAITSMVQQSDVRKATAYRGNLRTYHGNHEVIGLDPGLARRVGSDPSLMNTLLADLEKALGPEAFESTPFAKTRDLLEVKPASPFATILHFKWIKGLSEKLSRRFKTEEYSRGQYWVLRQLFAPGRRFSLQDVGRLCKTEGLPGMELAQAPRAFQSREFLMLFYNIKLEHLQLELLKQGVDQDNEERLLANFLQHSIFSLIARERSLPVY